MMKPGSAFNTFSMDDGCLYVTVPHLRPLENCLWVQCLGLAWIVLVGLDPTDVLTSPEAPFPQTLKWQVIRCRSDSLLLLKGYF